MSRGLLGKNSPIHIRQNRRDALKDADLVLLAGQTHCLNSVSRQHSYRLPRIPREILTLCVVFAGTVCDFRLSYGRVLSRRSKIIAVNRDKTQLLKNSDMFWKPSVAIQGTLSMMQGRADLRRVVSR